MRRLLPFARADTTTLTEVDLSAKQRSAEFVLAHLEHAVLFDDHGDCLRYAVERALATAAPDAVLVELGVYRGRTLRQIAATAAQRQVVGFDTFAGLPADWAGHRLRRGHYGTGGRLPRVGATCALYPGLFAESIPRFLAECPGVPVAFVHVDCDLYSSTRTALELLGGRLGPGSVLLLDEHHGYPGWEHGERRALEEWAEAAGRAYRYVAFSVESAAVELV